MDPFHEDFCTETDELIACLPSVERSQVIGTIWQEALIPRESHWAHATYQQRECHYKSFLIWCPLIIVKADSSPIVRIMLPFTRGGSMKTSRRFTTSMELQGKEWSESTFFKHFSVTFCQGNRQILQPPLACLYETEEKDLNHDGTHRP